MTFDNSIAALELDERRARVTIRRSAPETDDRLAARAPARARSHAALALVSARRAFKHRRETRRYLIRSRYDAGARIGHHGRCHPLRHAVRLPHTHSRAASRPRGRAGDPRGRLRRRYAPSDATGLPDVSLKVGSTTNNPGTTLTILGLLTLLTVAPSILVMMTGFTRILIVLSFVRNALGTQQMPPNQVLVGFALFLSLFVMAPTLRQINHDALQPYLAHKIEAKPALLKAEIPIKRFMLKQTRASDLALFLKLAHQKPPEDARPGADSRRSCPRS